MVWTAVVAVVVVGVLLPQSPAVGPVATFVESFFSLQIVIAALVGLALALVAWRLGAGRIGATVASIALLATLGALIPVFALIHAANLYGAELSWLDQLCGATKSAQGIPIQTIRYATVEGKDLYVDIYSPPNRSPEKSPPASTTIWCRSQGISNWWRN